MWEQHKKVLSFISIVLVYSTDSELFFILNIQQAVLFPVSKQLEQPGVEPVATANWDVSPTDISEALLLQ